MLVNNPVRKILFLFLFVWCFQMANAQKGFSSGKTQVKFSPIKFLDLVNPGAEFSLEKKFRKRSSVQLSYGFMKDFFGTTPYSSFAGNRLGVEQKFFSRKPSRDKNYFSLELVYAGVHYDSQDSFGYKPPGTDSVLYFYPDSIHVYRETAAFNFKLGRQFFIKHIVVDVAIGVGLKYKHVAHINRIVPSDLLQPPRHPNAYYEADREGSFFTGNVPIAFKIGYSF